MIGRIDETSSDSEIKITRQTQLDGRTMRE